MINLGKLYSSKRESKCYTQCIKSSASFARDGSNLFRLRLWPALMMELISRPRAVSKYKLCWVTNSWSVKNNQVSHERYNRDCNKISSRFNLVICRHRVYGQLIILWPWQLLCHARGQVAILCTCRDPFGTNLNWNLWRIDCDKIDAYGLVLSSFQVKLTSIFIDLMKSDENFENDFKISFGTYLK